MLLDQLTAFLYHSKQNSSLSNEKGYGIFVYKNVRNISKSLNLVLDQV